MKNILEVRNLETYFFTNNGYVSALRRVSFDLHEGEILSIVGESGSGKTVLINSILRMYDTEEMDTVLKGEVIFNKKNILEVDNTEINSLRKKYFSMIFQDPSNSLNPIKTVGSQIKDFLMIIEKNGKKAELQITELLKIVGISDPENRKKSYPFELSGGMQQRVMIAMAIAKNPSIIFADEPTTALDVTIQKQILSLISKINKDFQTTIVLVTHDLGIVEKISDRIIVMYSGEIMEIGTRNEIFANQLHPYTKGLMLSRPGLEPQQKRELFAIKGNVPNIKILEKKCPFYERCYKKQNKCKVNYPPLFSIDKRYVRCFFPEAGGQSNV